MDIIYIQFLLDSVMSQSLARSTSVTEGDVDSVCDHQHINDNKLMLKIILLSCFGCIYKNKKNGKLGYVSLSWAFVLVYIKWMCLFLDRLINTLQPGSVRKINNSTQNWHQVNHTILQLCVHASPWLAFTLATGLIQWDRPACYDWVVTSLRLPYLAVAGPVC